MQAVLAHALEDLAVTVIDLVVAALGDALAPALHVSVAVADPRLEVLGAVLESGEKRLLWTTFTPQQVDIDVTHPLGEAYLRDILGRFQAAGDVDVIKTMALGDKDLDALWDRIRAL